MNNRYKVYCFDLDGTIYHGSEPVKEAISLIHALQNNRIEPYYITNNSSVTREDVAHKLRSFGIEAEVSHIMTSAIATAQYCQDHYVGKTVQVIGEKGLQEALKVVGMTRVSTEPDLVIVGIDRAISYEKLATACLAIRAGATFIATNGDKAIPTERGLVPGAGSFMRLIEFSTGVAPIVLGKPEPYLLQMIQQESSCEKEEMILIGDNYDTDLLAGIRYGIATAHVEGGVTSKEEVLMKEVQPTYYLKDLAIETIQKEILR